MELPIFEIYMNFSIGLQHPCFKNLCKIAQASKNSDSNAQHFLLDLLTHSWFHSMLFALPCYQFPYTVMNRCLYPTTKPGNHGTPNAHNRWISLFYHVWRHAWIDVHWNSIWLRAQLLMTSHYTLGSMTTLHDFGGVLEQPLHAFFWALTISWSRFLARVKWPQYQAYQAYHLWCCKCVNKDDWMKCNYIHTHARKAIGLAS